MLCIKLSHSIKILNFCLHQPFSVPLSSCRVSYISSIAYTVTNYLNIFSKLKFINEIMQIDTGGHIKSNSTFWKRDDFYLFFYLFLLIFSINQISKELLTKQIWLLLNLRFCGTSSKEPKLILWLGLLFYFKIISTYSSTESDIYFI